MSCPVASTEGLFRQLPLLTFEILFVYLLITRFSIGFVVISVGFGVSCLLYGVYWNYKYQKLYNFVHTATNINNKRIPIPNNTNTDITIYCFKVPKQALFSLSIDPYPFAMPQNFNLLSNSTPFQELNAAQFIQNWKDRGQSLKPYCIDPFDLSIWFIHIKTTNINQFNSTLSANQYNWNKTVQSYKTDNSCILYRISKDDFIKLCKYMQQNELITSMKTISSHLALIYDTDFDDECSTADNVGYLMQLSSADKSIQFISNHCALTALQYRYVQLKRSRNTLELRQLKSQLIHLLHYYFLFLYGTLTLHSSQKNVLLKMRTSDLFWNDFLLIALPGIKKFFAYQSIYKSIEVAYNYYCRNDSICYFLYCRNGGQEIN